MDWTLWARVFVCVCACERAVKTEDEHVKWIEKKKLKEINEIQKLSKVRVDQQQWK